jgi:hypothetical protein
MVHLLTNKIIAVEYLKSYFIPDLLSCIPGIISQEYLEPNSFWFFFKLFRYTQLPRTFVQLEHLLRLVSATGRKWVVENIIVSIKRNVLFLLCFHIVACVWIRIGMTEEADGE